VTVAPARPGWTRIDVGLGRGGRSGVTEPAKEPEQYWAQRVELAWP